MVARPGPLHVYIADPLPLVTPDAESVSVPPEQRAVADAVSVPTEAGSATVTDDVTTAALVQPVPGYVTVRLYTPLEAEVVGVNDALTEVPDVL